MKKIFVLIIACLVFSFAQIAIAAKSSSHAHNESGISEVAVKVVFIQPFGEFDMVMFTPNPVVNIAGSGCSVEGGTTSFPSSSGSDTSRGFYQNGGVTFIPSSIGLNEITAIWPVDNPMIDGVGGRTGVSNHYVFEIDSSLSGTTQWKLKVYKWESKASSGDTPYLVEIAATSGGSVYVGPTVGYNYTPWNSGVSLTYFTSSTTAYAVNRIGWDAGVTKYFIALGKK